MDRLCCLSGDAECVYKLGDIRVYEREELMKAMGRCTGTGVGVSRS
jgi:hypothetical protein